MYSDSGGSAYGKAIYFASSVSSSSGYSSGAPSNNVMLRAKVTGGRSISDSKLSTDFRNAINHNDPIAKACARADGSSARNLYALAKGYDIITTNDYHMVLNRRCLSVSNRIKPNISYSTRTW